MSLRSFNCIFVGRIRSSTLSLWDFQRHDGAETFGPVRPGERSGLPKPRELEEKACATLQWGYSQTLMSYFSRLSTQDYILTVPESHFGYG